MKTVIWLQASQLNAQHDIFDQVKNYDAVLFVWDEKLFDQSLFSKQRQFFIWQCLQEFKRKRLMVIKGQTHQVLMSLYEQNPLLKIFTPESQNFNFDRWQFVQQLPSGQFIVYDKQTPFGFFKFWDQVEKHFLTDRDRLEVVS